MIPYEELLRKYNMLLLEYQRLREENEQLKAGSADSASAFPCEKKREEQQSGSENTVSRYSTPEEKIRLFRSLFRGREDVFARRWYSVKTEKSGYQPVCGNE